MADARSEFAAHAEDNRRIWNANAQWWDDQIGDGNAFQTLLIEPATERLLAVEAADTILDIACGAGRFSRRMADLGARVVAFDQSEVFIARARERSGGHARIEYFAIAAELAASTVIERGPFSKAVCTMALMDMPALAPVFALLSAALVRNGTFVFAAGFVVDGMEEPRLPPSSGEAGLRWSNMSEIPPILVVRMKRQ